MLGFWTDQIGTDSSATPKRAMEDLKVEVSIALVPVQRGEPTVKVQRRLSNRSKMNRLYLNPSLPFDQVLKMVVLDMAKK